MTFRSSVMGFILRAIQHLLPTEFPDNRYTKTFIPVVKNFAKFS